MSADEHPLQPMPEETCWQYLALAQVGRLATALDRYPEIFPINFVVDDHTIVFRTAEGSKLFELTINENVAFEIDGWDQGGGWSVVVKGEASEITASAEIDQVEQLDLRPFVPTVKRHWIRITPSEVTGRMFRTGEEPDDLSYGG